MDGGGMATYLVWGRLHFRNGFKSSTGLATCLPVLTRVFYSLSQSQASHHRGRDMNIYIWLLRFSQKCGHHSAPLQVSFPETGKTLLSVQFSWHVTFLKSLSLRGYLLCGSLEIKLKSFHVAELRSEAYSPSLASMNEAVILPLAELRSLGLEPFTSFSGESWNRSGWQSWDLRPRTLGQPLCIKLKLFCVAVKDWNLEPFSDLCGRPWLGQLVY